MNKHNLKSGYTFATIVTLAVFAVIFFGLTIAPANAATDGWHIKDDATGGDCSLIGIWDAGSKTCTLSQDLSQGIIIDSHSITLDGNGHTITGSNTGNGVYLSSRTRVTIKNLNIDKFNYGILLWWSSNNTLTDNTASNNNSSGIFLHSSSNNTLIGNTASNNRYGISLYGSSNNNNTLIGNTASNNSMYGISIEAPSNTLTDNTASNNTIGIDLSYYSRNNTLTDNIAQENSYYDLRVRGDTTIDCSNTITNTTGSGGRPIKYFNNAVNLSNETLSGLILCNADGSNIHDITIDGSATKQNNGLVFIRTDSSTIANVNSSNNYTGIQLHSSTGNTLTGNTASSNSNTGIDLVYSSNNTLTSNTASNNGSTGIYLQYSSNNTLTSNTASNNSTGIWIYYSNYNTITENTANSNNGYYGISISYSSSNNIVTGNTASNNRFGIAIYGSSSIYGSQPLNNQTYKNNFIGNTTQVFAISGSGVFNLASPIGGNYWSNYDEPLEGCNDLNQDNFCDSPYIFSGGQDNLPWTKKDGWLSQLPENSPPTLSYSQDEGFVDDGINPDEGDTNTNFVFKIVYTDLDNDSPTDIRTIIFDGSPSDSPAGEISSDAMILDFSASPELRDGNYVNGEQYELTRLFPVSTYRYRFQASDGKIGTILDGIEGGKEQRFIISESLPVDTDGDCLSDSREQQIGTSLNNVDTDGDGLFDGWEAANWDMENNCQPLELDLVSLGANPIHKDIFLEIDWMDCSMAESDCAEGDNHSHILKDEAKTKIIEAFANAPVSNPDEASGITLHIDVSNRVIHHKAINFDAGILGLLPSGFDKIKRDNFDDRRKRFYHYALFAHNFSILGLDYLNSGIAERPGNDFMVTLGDFTDQVGSLSEQAGTLMHELGHNLGLSHGGGETFDPFSLYNYKPNYLSVMNYHFQVGGIRKINGATRFDYSGEILPTLDEGNLNETHGIQDGTDITYYFCQASDLKKVLFGNEAADWDCDGNNTEENISTDINSSLLNAKTQLRGFNDWNSLIYRFQDTIDFLDGIRENTVNPETELDSKTVENLSLDYEPYQVNVDIRPDSNINPVNLKSKGVLPVVIFGNEKFNVSTILIDSVVLFGSTDKNHNHFEDINNDGFVDLILHFPIPSLTSITPDSKFGEVSGKTTEKLLFVGRDKISIVPSK